MKTSNGRQRTFRLEAKSNPQLVVETAGTGPPLLFAHGLTGCRHAVIEQFHPLSDRFTVITFDQRGHGENAVTDPDLLHPRVMAEDIGAVLDSIGVHRAVVGGESMGAATALTFAMAHPERVEALLLSGPAFADVANPEAAVILEIAETITAVGIKNWADQGAEKQRKEYGWPDPVIERIWRYRTVHEATSLAAACRAVANWTIVDDLDELAAISIPTCILAWEGDPMHPIELARRMAGTFPDCSLHVLPSLSAFFSDPSQVGRIFGDFLSMRTGSR